MATSLELYNQYKYLVSEAADSSEEDMCQDAHLGLWIAAKEFDPSNGYKFIDIARTNISFSIMIGIEDRLGVLDEWDDCVINPEDQAIEACNMETFLKSVSSLSHLDRLCVELPYSLSTLARMYGIPKTTLARNRQTILRYLLAKLC